MKTKNTKIRIAFIAIICYLILQPFCVQAIEMDLDNKNNYDIHFRSGEECGSVIRDVKILSYKEIGGKTFLVVEAEGFKLSDNKGYILLDAVTAILPSDNYRLVNGLKIINK